MNSSWNTPLTRRQALALATAFSAFSFGAFNLTGCSKNTPSGKTNTSGSTVIDCANRTVVVPDQVSNIACLYAYTGHVCVLLGCQDKIGAVVNGLKRDHLMERKIPNLASLPCPYNSGSINVEELAAVAPDLIFLRKDILQDAGELEKLAGLSAPYLVVDYITMEDQIRSIEMMGQATHCEERARAYTEYFRTTIELVKQRLSSISADQRLTVFHSVNEAVRTDIPGTLSYEIMEIAGCKNVVSSASDLHLDGDKGNATVEQIYLWDPDVVLANEPSATQYFRIDAKFSGLRAAREKRVIQLPVGISRWGHPGSVESPLAALYIAQLLYPQQFTDIDIKSEITHFYQRFFEIPLSDEDVEGIISGQGMREAREGAQQS